MIVVDSNVLLYRLLPGPFTDAAVALARTDPSWAAPRLWRSEVRNVLATYLRLNRITTEEALLTLELASARLGGGEYEVEDAHVLRLAQASLCSAYNCEFVACAQQLGVKLVTQDRALLQAFPAITLALHSFNPGTTP